jgi:outer membrane protein assembly factor BamD (BamD/ComL family)
MRRALVILAGAAAVLLSACASQSPVIPEGLSAAEIFQRAQDAAGKGDYQLGIRYYELVPKNYPDDREHNIWASYEIAFLYHKMGKNDVALNLLKDLLAQYATAGDTLPPGPKILAEKLQARLQTDTKTSG